EYVFDRCDQFVLDQIAQRHYDLYLLCEIDLPWVAEPMREYPDLQQRSELYNMYKDILVNQQTPWVEIRGNNKERLQRAVDAVEQYFVQQ
ncbi:MAG TPA: AAA family ATPase, partial [Parafilimonas sp.]|nr:AAA family ATPase [Parafilimonas sp.]